MVLHNPSNYFTCFTKENGYVFITVVQLYSLLHVTLYSVLLIENDFRR